MQCPKCSSELIDNMRYCPYCGLDFDARPYKTIAKLGAAQSGQKEYWDGPADSPAKHTHYGQSADDMKKPGYTLFSAKGCLNRLKYAYFLLFCSIAHLLLRTGLATGTPDSSAAWLISFYYPLFFFLVALQIITMIKRLHDMNKPGYHALLLLIPVYNISVPFRLLFKDSDISRANSYGFYERNSWYWQVPLTLLLLPVIYYGLTAGGIAQLIATRNAESLHYYSQSQQISMTFPAGWEVAEMDGYLTAMQDYSGRHRIALKVEETSDPSFSEYSDHEFELMVGNAVNTEVLWRSLGFQPWEVSGKVSSQRTINGVKFIVVDFTQTVRNDRYRHLFLLGCQDRKHITVHLILTHPYGLEAAGMFAAVDTLRIGSSATAEPAKWD